MAHGSGQNGPFVSDATPNALVVGGSGSAGSNALASRADHVHPFPALSTFLTFGNGLDFSGAPTLVVKAADSSITVGASGISGRIAYGGLVTAASKTYVAADNCKYYERINGGSPMTDTITLAAGDAGWVSKVANNGTTVAETITFTLTTGLFPNGTSTYVLNYGCRQTFVWTGTKILFDAGNGNIPRFNGAAVANNFPAFNDTTGRLLIDSGVSAASFVPVARTVSTTAPLTGGGALSGNLTLALTTSPAGQTPVGVTRQVNTTAPITGGGALSADLTLALTTSPVGQTPVGVTRQVNTTAPITGGGALSADLTLALTTSPAGQTPVGVTRQVNTTAPLAGGGALSADLTLTITAATATAAGSMSASDYGRVRSLYDAEADFGFVGDLVTVFEYPASGTFVVMTNGSAVINLPVTAPFTSTAVDGGKRITVSGAGAAGAVLVATILTVASASQATLSIVASTTVTTQAASPGPLIYCAVGFGTDNTTAINNMMTLVNTTNAAFPGVKIQFGQSPANRYGFPIPVVFNKTVHLVGIGGGFNTDNGDYTRIGGTCLCWWGASMDGGVDFGAFITIQPGAGAVQAIKNPSIKSLQVDGRNGDQNPALIGIRFAGCHALDLDEVFIMDCAAVGVIFDVTSVALAPTAERGCLRPRVGLLGIRSLESYTGAVVTPLTTSTAITLTNASQNITVSAATMPAAAPYGWVQTTEGTACLVKYTGGGTTTLGVKCSVTDAAYGYVTVSGSNVVSATPTNGCCMLVTGDATANANCGLFSLLQFTHGTTNWGPAALEVRNADSNQFVQLFINGGIPTNDGAINRIRKEGVRLAGSNVNVGLAARNNVFHDGDPSSAQAAGVSSMGLLNTGAKLAFPSGPNYWFGQQLANGARTPNVETFSSFGNLFPNGALGPGMAVPAAVAQQVIGASQTKILVNGSLIPVPPQGFQPGTHLRWIINVNQATAAAVVNTWSLLVGAAGALPGGTSADAVIAAQAFTATAVVMRTKLIIDWNIRTNGAAATSFMLIKVEKDTPGATGLTNAVNNLLVPACAAFSTVTSGLLYAGIYLTTLAGVSYQLDQVLVEFPKSANP